MFKNKVAGIYIGPQGLSVVEYSKGKVKNFAFNLYPQDLTTPSGIPSLRDSIFKVFLDNEVEIIAFIQKTIRDSKIDIESCKFVIAVPNRDLMVRFFEIPPIPKRDISATVGFEIKKYIPFKTEEMAYDYQTRSQGAGKVIEVLFAGIKNEDLLKYSSIIGQSKISVSAIEPAQFSLLRLLKIKKVITPKESVAILEFGRQDGAISIVDVGIPCFSRDIKIFSATELQDSDKETVFFRIINEVRVSIDYFRRQFLKKAIDRIIILSKDQSKELLDTFNKELSIPVVYRNPDDIIGSKDEYSLDLAKALGASFRLANISSLVINLSKKEHALTEQPTAEQAKNILFSPRIILDYLTELLLISKSAIIRSLFFILVVLIAVFFWSQQKIKPANQELSTISKKANSVLTGKLKGLDVSALESMKNNITNKLNDCRKNFTKDFLIAEKLEILPTLMPEGLWLEGEVSFDKGARSINLKGVVYRENEDEARALPYTFVGNLKNNPLFSNKVKFLSVKSLRSEMLREYRVIKFEINITIE